MSNKEAFEKFLENTKIEQFYKKGFYSESSKKTYLGLLEKFEEYEDDIFLINDSKKILEIIQKIRTNELIQNSKSNRETALKIYRKFLREEISIENERIEINQMNLSKTEKEYLRKARLGQGKYRKELISLWKGCSVSGITQESLLIASHIKPWSDSNNKERVDKFNGFLLLPTLDKLFDKGFISFNDNGIIIISRQIDKEDFDILNINENMKIKIFSENIPYLQYHQKEVFLDS